MIHKALVLGLGALAATSAGAFEIQGTVLEPVDGTFYANGIGSPAVVWDTDQERYLMLFETRLTDPTADCPAGEWAVGVAWSENGQDWTIWDEPVLGPTSGFRSCVVAHPTALYEDGEVHLWFKAHDADGPSGVGYAHGNVRVLTVEERADQLDERGDVLDQAQDDATDSLDAMLEAFQSTLRGERSTLAHDGHGALMAGHDLDREIHWAQKDLGAGVTPPLGPIFDAADGLLVELDDNTDPDAMALADETEAFLLALEEQAAAQDVLDEQKESLDLAVEEVLNGGWTREADFQGGDSAVIDVTRFGYPTVAKIDGRYTMLLAKVPNIYLATSTDRVNWTVNWTPVMEPGVTFWAPDELYNPALVCDETSDYPYIAYFGGRTMNLWWVESGGWSDAISDNAFDWLVNSRAYFEFSGTAAWRHWDVMRVGSETVVWFSDKDAQGRNRVKLASTAATWDPAEIHPRICN